MTHGKSELYFLITLLIGSILVSFFIFRPFLSALLLAAVVATVFAPLHRRILVGVRAKKGIAAFLTTLFVLVVVIVPLTFLGIQLFQEAAQLYSFLANGGGANVLVSLRNIFSGQEGLLSPLFDFSLDFDQYVEQVLQWLVGHLGTIFSNAARILVSIIIFLFALYYFFKDGQRLKEIVMTVSPLQDAHDRTVLDKLESAVNSIMKGKLVVAFLQGCLTAVGFVFFGISQSVLWGSLAAIAALVPGVGTALVFIPAVLYLFLIGNTVSAILLLLWGALAVGLIDNILGPKLVERGIPIHPFLILLSILGGIALWGPLGFLWGPLTLSLLSVLLEVYPMVRREHERENF